MELTRDAVSGRAHTGSGRVVGLTREAGERSRKRVRQARTGLTGGLGTYMRCVRRRGRALCGFEHVFAMRESLHPEIVAENHLSYRIKSMNWH